MTLERYAGWLMRGRTHQAEGRAIDAMLCYRRALREAANGVDARFHLGEIAWHFGSQGEAIASWQAAVERSPNHVPSLHALADAFAATAAFDDALEAARRVLAARPAEPRATALVHLLHAANRNAVEDALLAKAIRSERQWPLALLAAVGVNVLEQGQDCTQSVCALLDAAANSVITPSNEDHLRLLALAAARAGLQEHANAFADRYAQSCLAFHRSTMPLLWPLRTAGGDLRVGMIVLDESANEAATIASRFTRQSGVAAHFGVFVASPRGPAP